MTPAQLDALIHSQKKPSSHGDRNCPKCGTGYMGYYGSVYSCTECSWMESQHGPWTPVAKRKPAGSR